MQIYVVASGSLCEPEQQGQDLFMWRKIVHGCQLRGLSSPPSHLLLSVLYENCCPCQLSQNWPSQFHTCSICSDFVCGTMQANQANQSVHVCSYFSYHCRMKASSLPNKTESWSGYLLEFWYISVEEIYKFMFLHVKYFSKEIRFSTVS